MVYAFIDNFTNVTKSTVYMTLYNKNSITATFTEAIRHQTYYPAHQWR